MKIGLWVRFSYQGFNTEHSTTRSCSILLKPDWSGIWTPKRKYRDKMIWRLIWVPFKDWHSNKKKLIIIYQQDVQWHPAKCLGASPRTLNGLEWLLTPTHLGLISSRLVVDYVSQCSLLSYSNGCYLLNPIQNQTGCNTCQKTLYSHC